MPMGALPFIFIGNKTQAEVFLAVVQTYLNLNFDVPGFNSPMKKVALTLSLMQGPDVELWVNSIGRMLEQLDQFLLGPLPPPSLSDDGFPCHCYSQALPSRLLSSQQEAEVGPPFPSYPRHRLPSPLGG
jgi:hypothetical protein